MNECVAQRHAPKAAAAACLSARTRRPRLSSTVRATHGRDRSAARPTANAAKGENDGMRNRTAHLCGLLMAVVAVSGACWAQQPFIQGMPVVVSTDVLNVRNGPGVTRATIGQQRRGAHGTIVDPSPFWADGYWWWNVAFADGERGWAADGSATEAFLVDASTGSVREPTVASTVPDWVHTRLPLSESYFLAEFWGGRMPLECAEARGQVIRHDDDSIPVVQACTTSKLSDGFANDVFVLEDMAQGHGEYIDIRLVGNAATSAGRMYVVEHFDSFESGNRSIIHLYVFLEDLSGVELIAALTNRDGASPFRLIAVDGAAHLVTDSGSVFESRGGDFEHRTDLSYAPLLAATAGPMWSAERVAVRRQRALARLAEMQEEGPVAPVPAATLPELSYLVEELTTIATSGQLTPREQNARYVQLQERWDATLLATAVRLVPVYDPSTRSVQSFDTFARELVGESDADAPFGRDPVGSTVSLVFDPSIHNITRQLGLPAW